MPSHVVSCCRLWRKGKPSRQTFDAISRRKAAKVARSVGNCVGKAAPRPRKPLTPGSWWPLERRRNARSRPRQSGMSDEPAPLAGMLDLRSDGVYCIPCRRLLRSIGSHLKKHGVHGKHNRSTLQRLFGLPMGTRFASRAVRHSLHAAATENGAVLAIAKNRPNVWEATRAASIARQRGQRSIRQQAAVYALGAGVGRATLPAARARHRELSRLRNHAVITCEYCALTVVIGRRAPSFPWSRFCSRLCETAHREAPSIYQRISAAELADHQRGRLAWLIADQRRRGRRTQRKVEPLR